MLDQVHVLPSNLEMEYFASILYVGREGSHLLLHIVPFELRKFLDQGHVGEDEGGWKVHVSLVTSISPGLCQNFLEFRQKSVDRRDSPQSNEHDWGDGVMTLDCLNSQSVATLPVPFHDHIPTEIRWRNIRRDGKTEIDGVVHCLFPFAFESPERGVDSDELSKYCHVAWYIFG